MGARRLDTLTQPLLPRPSLERIGEHAVLLPGFAQQPGVLLAAVQQIVSASPWRHMVTPGGFTMSVATTNCGQVGWVSDRQGYRYQRIDPESARSWPTMPACMSALATRAAAVAGFAGFQPDACLINRYVPGSRLSAHQDRNERDLSAPVVSVSLGLPVIFLLGGATRRDRAIRLALTHGDVLVWGGSQRLAFHSVLKLADGDHPLTGRCRINLTFRRAL